MMKINERYIKYIILFTFLISNSCTTTLDIPQAPKNPTTDEDYVRVTIIKKAQAIFEKNKDTFLDTLDRSNVEFYNEQRRWFDDYLNTKTEGFILKIKAIRKVDETTCIADLHQEYYYIEKISGGVRKSRRISDYIEMFIKADRGWLDSGPFFVEKRTDNFIIKFPGEIGGAAPLDKVAKEAEEAYQLVLKSFGKKIDELTVLKFYKNREHLRQSTRISRSGQLDGWYGHSGGLIKLYLMKQESDSHVATIAHELIHKITISMTTNLADWFAEGLAVHYGSYAGTDDSYVSEGRCEYQDLMKSIDWLENRNAHDIIDHDESNVYYGMSGMVVKHMADVYGDEKVKQIVEGLSKYPDVKYPTSRRVYEKAMNKYLRQEIKKVLGLGGEAFNASWMDWIKKQSVINKRTELTQ